MPRAKTQPALIAEDTSDAGSIYSAGDAAATLGDLQASYGQSRDLVNQLLGQAQMADAFSQFSRAARSSKLALVKEHKLYREIRGMKTPRGAELTGTWKEFCELLGLSVDVADRDVASLKAFGQEALEAMTRAGIGYRELGKFRVLPADQQTLLIEAAKSGDKETLLELAEDLIAKHAKEKETLGTSLAEAHSMLEDAKGDREAKDKVIGALKTKLQGRKLPELTPDSVATELVKVVHEAEATACAWVEGHLKQAIAAVLAHDADHDSNHRSVLSGYIAQVEDAAYALRVKFALPRTQEIDHDPLRPMPEKELDKLLDDMGYNDLKADA